MILAIEPDVQQAAQLVSIADGIDAELVLRNSVESAFEVFRGPLPDLILTPALLSLRDDLALTHRLRALGGAGAHIQTLTIPMLESPASPSPGRGILSWLRRAKPPASEPARCTAGVFAEQVAAYLARAAAASCRNLEPEPAPHKISVEMQIVEPDIGINEIDNWHFFDPEQHRFAALAARLDAICQS